MNTRTWIVGLLCCLGVLLSAVSPAAGQVTYPPRVGDRDFVADEAKLLSSEDKASIRSTSEQLLESKGIPIIVVTINSMADYGTGGWNIERYAMNLFDEWGIGHSGGRNGGILLLVSKNDRKVRIELGGTWSHDRDADAASIINSIIVPRFKNKQFSEGIRMGVEALASQLGGAHAAAASPAGSFAPSVPGVVRGSAPSSPLHSTGLSKLLGPVACLVVPIIFIIVISIISRVGRGIGGGMMGGGSGGYGPMGWGGGGGGGGFMSGAILGGLLGNAWGSRHSGSSWGRGGSSGGGFSSGSFGGGGGGGGSFGGGFSGGGGATGSW